jgi:hypothetical protein
VGAEVRGLCAAALCATAIVFAAAPGAAAEVECWRGWGYWVDRQTGAYASEELLLVTRGPAIWEEGRRVVLHLLDRASGRIDPSRPAITAIQRGPRTYYRGRTNYVDARGEVPDAAHDLVFGLSHIAPPTAAIEKLAEYNRWACGLSGAAE